ncbi:hypothetical protein PQX77_021637 [Marasmius sp. AFHP31]|nr:hypothetical protein PQX77_021637 [Marasmius sp. AFHP31]
MSGTSFFDHTLKPTLFHPSFVAANVINNYAYPERPDTSNQGQSTSLIERPSSQLDPRLRTVNIEDIILRKEVSSKVIDVMTKPREKGRVFRITNPFRARVIRQRQAKFSRARRTIHTAEIMQFGDRTFTVVQLEAEDPNDSEQLQLAIRKHVFEISSSRRQLFAVGSSDIPTLIYHDGLISADGIIGDHTQSPIVSAYLHYIYGAAYDSFDRRFLEKISVRLSGLWEDWLFNLQTGTFQFDLTSNRQLSYEDSHLPRRLDTIALPGNALMGGLLTPQSIIQHLRNQFSDYLNSVSLLGQMRHTGSLSEFIMTHPYLVIGSVIDVTKPGIIAHIPSSDVFVNPEHIWMCGIDPDDGIDVDQYQFYESVLIDGITFALYGHFENNPLNYCAPIYLFVPPVPFNEENGIPGLALPLPYRLFYWSLDPEGRTSIPEKDWEEYRVPRLKTELWLGPFWDSWCYEAVDEFFRLGNHDPQTYARDRGYPVLQKWQDNRFSVVAEVATTTRYPTWKGMGSSYEEPLFREPHVKTTVYTEETME